MTRSNICVAGLCLVLASCTTPGERRSNDAQSYSCELEQAGPTGTVTLGLWVERDGTRWNHSEQWVASRPRDGARLQIERFGVGPLASTDETMVTVSFRRRWMARRRLRVELFRNLDQRRTGEAILANPYYVRGRDPVLIMRRQSELRSLAAGAPFLIAGVAEEGSDLLTQDRIDLSLFDAAAQEIAAARPQLEAMVADFRQACEIAEGRMIVT